MTNCLKEALMPLKESSKWAIADAEGTFEDIKEYLHIEREIEIELVELLKKSANEDSKCLVLVCGNVGDGKSHLLLRISSKHKEMMSKFHVLNDATESFRPDQTNIEALVEALEEFKDENLNNGKVNRTVLAINLGTINNFLFEQNDEGFSELDKFVKEKKILEVGAVKDNILGDSGPFRFVNFCDHNLFKLTEHGPRPDIIETAITKVVKDDEKNPFYKIYLRHKTSHLENCPIRYNFEFLQVPENRLKVSQLLAESIVRFQLIVSIRALYNFIYDMIVPYQLAPLSCLEEMAVIREYKELGFMKDIIPNYIFEHPEISPIFNFLQFLDPASKRNEIIDKAATGLMTSENPKEVFQEYVSIDPSNLEYMGFFNSSFQSSNDMQNYQLKIFIRFAFFFNKKDNMNLVDESYFDFMKLLYFYYNGEKKQLKKLFGDVHEAALKWFGEAEGDSINVLLGRQQLDYRFSRKVEVEANPLAIPVQSKVDTIVLFEPSMVLDFMIKKENQKIEINYRLYEFILKIISGYRPSKIDYNNYFGFTKFVEKIVESKNEESTIFITESISGKRYQLKLDSFEDYCFGEVIK